MVSVAAAIESYLSKRTKLPVALRFESDRKFEAKTGSELKIYRIPLKSISKTFFEKKKEVVH